MKGFGKQRKHKKKQPKANKKILIPGALEEFKGNFSLSTNKSAKPTKEEIINKVFKFHSEGNIPEAVRYYELFINLGFKDCNIFSNYGIILRRLGKLQEAELFTRKSIEMNPNNADAYVNLGNILIDLGKSKEAESSQRIAIKLNPNLAMAHNNLGNTLKDLGQLKEAEISTRKAIEINPDLAISHNNLGSILKDKGQLQEAEISARKAIEIKPDFAEAHCNLGSIMKDLGQLKEAEISARKSIELKPDYAVGNFNLGCILLDIYDKYQSIIDLKEAELYTRKTIELKPDYPDAHFNLGSILLDSDKLEESHLAYKKSLEINPKQIRTISKMIFTSAHLCMWDQMEKYIPDLNRLGIEGKAVNPLELMYVEDNPLNHLKRAVKYNQEHKKEELPNVNHKKNKKIKIGYFSSDFRNHPVTHLLIRTLELHDKSKFDIYAYSLSKVKDDYTIRVKKAVSTFREINNLSDLDIVKLARNDQIDIAIDLNGITKFHRASIFSYRVAPIQINYLGYTGSLGSDSYDYILADKVLIPEENKKFYTEKVLHLPNSSYPHDNTRKVSVNKFSREQLGLPVDGFVFTCFNAIQKITRKEFNIWLRLLHSVEGSVLWLIKPHQVAMNNLYSELINHGLDKERIIFAEHMKLDEHLSRQACADLFLDTFNFNAATTANFALSSGLPVITLLGKSYSARIGASILSACNLNELITTSHAEYESLACELATNKEKLKAIREKLINKNKLSFFDSSKFTNELELIYNKIINT